MWLYDDMLYNKATFILSLFDLYYFYGKSYLYGNIYFSGDACCITWNYNLKCRTDSSSAIYCNVLNHIVKIASIHTC